MRTTLSTFVKYAAVTGSYSMCCQFWCVCVCVYSVCSAVCVLWRSVIVGSGEYRDSVLFAC